MDSIKIKVCSSNNGEKNSEPVIQPSKSQQQVRPYLNFFKTTSINEKMIKDTTASKLLLRDKLSITINTPKNLLINQKPKLSRHNFRNNISSSKDPNLTFSKKLSRNQELIRHAKLQDQQHNNKSNDESSFISVSKSRSRIGMSSLNDSLEKKKQGNPIKLKMFKSFDQSTNLCPKNISNNINQLNPYLKHNDTRYVLDRHKYRQKQSSLFIERSNSKQDKFFRIKTNQNDLSSQKGEGDRRSFHQKIVREKNDCSSLNTGFNGTGESNVEFYRKALLEMPYMKNDFLKTLNNKTKQNFIEKSNHFSKSKSSNICTNQICYPPILDENDNQKNNNESDSPKNIVISNKAEVTSLKSMNSKQKLSNFTAHEGLLLSELKDNFMSENKASSNILEKVDRQKLGINLKIFQKDAKVDIDNRIVTKQVLQKTNLNHRKSIGNFGEAIKNNDYGIFRMMSNNNVSMTALSNNLACNKSTNNNNDTSVCVIDDSDKIIPKKDKKVEKQTDEKIPSDIQATLEISGLEDIENNIGKLVTGYRFQIGEKMLNFNEMRSVSINKPSIFNGKFVSNKLNLKIGNGHVNAEESEEIRYRGLSQLINIGDEIINTQKEVRLIQISSPMGDLEKDNSSEKSYISICSNQENLEPKELPINQDSYLIEKQDDHQSDEYIIKLVDNPKDNFDNGDILEFLKPDNDNKQTSSSPSNIKKLASEKITCNNFLTAQNSQQYKVLDIKPAFDSEEFITKLIKYIYKEDINAIKNHLFITVKLYQKEFYQVLNEKDKNGQTPLILSTKLAYKNKDAYYRIVEVLLENNADPYVKDNEGWSAFEHAIGAIDVQISSQLFDYMVAHKQEKLLNEFSQLEQALKLQKNFKMKIKWELDSSIVPLVSKIAPSDTYTVWKKGKSLRLDSTLVGFKNLKTKRRPMSFIFNPTNSNLSTNYEKVQTNGFHLWTLNHDKKVFTNPLDNVTLEEKKAILWDLLNSLPVQGEMKLVKSSQTHTNNIFGKRIHQKYYGKNSVKWNLSLKMDYILNKKSKALFDQNLNDYLVNYNTQVGDNVILKNEQIELNTPEKSSKNASNKKETSTAQCDKKKGSNNNDDQTFSLNKKKYNFELQKTQSKSTNVGIWICPNFGITLKVLQFRLIHKNIGTFTNCSDFFKWQRFVRKNERNVQRKFS